jgi:thiamine biosynthesis lipoprotein
LSKSEVFGNGRHFIADLSLSSAIVSNGRQGEAMTSERPTRRFFLLQSRLAAARSTSPPRASSPPLTTDRGRLVVSVRRRIMACEFEVQLSASRDDDSMEHVFAALDLAEALEAQITVYRTDSEVIRINHSAAQAPVHVEPRLFELFRLADRLHRETDGAYDITSNPLSEAWGFSRRAGRVPTDAAIDEARQRVGMLYVALDGEAGTVAFRKQGVSVNFNSIGKGYALDRMAELLAMQSVDDYLVHGGKSSVLARGGQPGHERGWTVGLRHPLRPAQRLAEFRLRDQALSTSGSGTQFFIRRGRRYGHILDPRTGRPAEGLYSATVIAPTAAEADALSTAFYVMGPDAVKSYCEAHPEISALLVAPAEREGDVQLFAIGLNDEHWLPS